MINVDLGQKYYVYLPFFFVKLNRPSSDPVERNRSKTSLSSSCSVLHLIPSFGGGKPLTALYIYFKIKSVSVLTERNSHRDICCTMQGYFTNYWGFHPHFYNHSQNIIIYICDLSLFSTYPTVCLKSFPALYTYSEF